MYENKIGLVDEYKQNIDSFRPLSENALAQLKAYFKVSLTYTSNAIEGNSLTLTETKIIIEDGLTIGGKPMRDHLEVIGHSDAYDLLYNLANNHEITEKEILLLHHLFYKNINEEKAGVYRDCNVIITGSDFELPKFSEVPKLMKNFSDNVSKMKEQYHPVEFAARLHEGLVTIHPFVDGNGRAARLLMNLALLQAGYNITIIPPIVRNDYIDALKEAQINNNKEPFVNFISEMVLESQKDYLRLLNALN